MAGSDAEVPYEQAIARLEQVVRELEAGERSLDEALALFQEGVALVRQCTQRLDAAAARIEKVMADGSVTPLDPPEGSEP